jgi:histone deacetylase complex regulatory component SIN3
MKVEQVKAPFLIGDFLIEQVCDTVEIMVDGVIYKAPPKVKNFDYETVIDSLKAVISLRNNVFSVNISQKERILSEKESTIQRQKERIERLESIEKTSINLKLILGALVVGFAVGYLRPWRWVKT